MTDDHSNHDRTDAPTDPDRTDDSAGEADADLSRRRFMQGAAASVTGAAGLAALGDAAEAAPNAKRLLVVSRGPRFAGYTIELEAGGSIQKAHHAGDNDATSTTPDGRERAEGYVWRWMVDSYTFTGEIARLEGEGRVSFHFQQPAFTDDERIVVSGESEGTHHVTLGTNSGDIDPGPTAEREETDRGGPGTEGPHSPDEMRAKLVGTGVDDFTIGRRQPLRYVHVDGGHVTVDPYSPGHSTTPDNGKEASLVYFYMGDGPFTTFFQNFIALNQAVKGYDRSILLKHSNQNNGLSGRAANNADDVRTPTRDNFERTLRELADDGYDIDLYIVSHGDRNSFKMSTGSHGSEDWYSYADIQALRASYGSDFPLRLVYQTNCWGANLNDAWVDLGADVSTGSRFVNFFPNQFQKFARNWRNGRTVTECLNRSDTFPSRQAVKGYLNVDMTSTHTQYWGSDSGFCTQLAVFQGQGACAEDYFTNRWRHNQQEWDSVSVDGWDFVKHASEKPVAGDRAVTR